MEVPVEDPKEEDERNKTGGSAMSKASKASEAKSNKTDSTTYHLAVEIQGHIVREHAPIDTIEKEEGANVASEKPEEVARMVQTAKSLVRPKIDEDLTEEQR